MLPKMLAFLQPFRNQEYLVLRIKELAKGDHIGSYQWGYTRKADYIQDWLDYLPTDAAILFHLFCVYLDSQLMPKPQDDGQRPFFSRFVIIWHKRLWSQQLEGHLPKQDAAIRVQPEVLVINHNIASFGHGN